MGCSETFFPNEIILGLPDVIQFHMPLTKYSAQNASERVGE